MKLLTKMIATVVVATMASNASALIIDLANEGSLVGSGDNRSYQYTGSDFSVTVDGYEEGFTDRERVTRNSRGLGVASEGDLNNQLDGVGGTEWLRFTVAGGGILDYVDASQFGWNDDFSLMIDGVYYGDYSADPWTGAIAFSSWFAIGANHRSDEFRLRKVGITVPEPSTLVLMLIGILGIGAARKLS